MMKENLPPPVSGTDFESAYHNRVRQNVRQARILPGPGYRVKQFAGGTAIEIIPRGGGRAGTPTTNQVFQYASGTLNVLMGDWVVAYPQKSDGTFDAGTPTKIAKPYRMRNSVASEVIGGVTYNYAYDSTTVQRNVTWTFQGTNYSEFQVIVPPWTAQQIILATKLSITGVNDPATGNDVGWIDLNINAMAWMRQFS